MQTTARIDSLLAAELKKVGPKPPDSAKREPKQKYSQIVSNAIATAFADELRTRGLPSVMPAAAVAGGKAGAERRMSGGLGAKRVDVTWATEESGLVLAISVKTINFRDVRSGHFQKNLTNRRGDMLFEAVTLHRRFPYAVLAGFLFLDKDAATDGTSLRKSTFENAHDRLLIFTGRDDPAGRDEQYERLYVPLLDPNPKGLSATAYAVGDTTKPVAFAPIFDELIDLVATRNSDFYESVSGNLVRRRA